MKSETANRKSLQAREGRLALVAELYRRGHSLRQIRAAVMERQQLATYSLDTVHRDVKLLLAEWREARRTDTAAAAELELERVDEAVRELWEQWERSKGRGPAEVSYIAEIRRQLAERRRLLGLYAPERREVALAGPDLSALTEEQRALLLEIGERALEGNG